MISLKNIKVIIDIYIKKEKDYKNKSSTVTQVSNTCCSKIEGGPLIFDSKCD
jgi:hypothetical protein